jgi:hypothetical protein
MEQAILMADIISIGAPSNSTEAVITLMETDEPNTKSHLKTPHSSAMTLPALIQTTPSRWTPSEPQPTIPNPMDDMLKALMNCLDKKLDPITERLNRLEKAKANQEHVNWYDDPTYRNYTQDQLLDYQGILSPPVPSPTGSPQWTEWSHTWGREMMLRRALEKLNLEYLADSD